MTHQIIDGNNFFRRMLETGQTIRGIFQNLYTATESTFVVWDGPGSLKARRAIFPGYKVKDKPVDSNIFVNFDQIRDVLNFAPVFQIRVPNVEADDVIATLVESLNHDVFIHSTDKDFLQLDVPCSAKPIEGVPAELMRLYKTFVGDGSDKIPGCVGFGKGAWDAADPAELGAWLHHGHDYEFPKRAKPDREQLLKYWEIIGFLPVTITADHLTTGVANLAAAEEYFKQWMM